MSLSGKELEELRESEARSRIVVETVADAIVTINDASIILFVNPAAEKIFGYAAPEMLGAHMTMLMPDYLRHLHDAGMQRYVETGVKHISWAGVELPGLHKSGHEIPLEISFGEFTLDGRRYFTGIARDISTRKHNEARLAAQYDVTRALAETRDFREAVPRILRAVCEALNWEVGALWTLDRDADVLRFVELWCAPNVDVREFEMLSSRRTFTRDGDGGLPGRVWESGEPLWVEDIAADETFPRSAAAAREGLHGAFAFPALVQGETIAVLEFFSREVRAPDDALLAMMSHVGSQIGQVVERQRAVAAQAHLRDEMIHVQDELLAELSTPLIPLNREIVVMPLVGAVDAKRARRVLGALLSGLEQSRARVAIIDITGVSVVDEHVANTLVQSAQAARLLGTEVILTGIRAGVARSLVRLGVDLRQVTTRKSLQDGIASAFEYLRARGTND
ncbi:MAG: two-component system, cell cycle sensor histidine kinase and response regulator CckA [Acidobacteriota bacterium]|nr:two-component system, cell cycle sensor histidine kinase and response regulator CckA [Acidobacteriota bacterium]